MSPTEIARLAAETVAAMGPNRSDREQDRHDTRLLKRFTTEVVPLIDAGPKVKLWCALKKASMRATHVEGTPAPPIDGAPGHSVPLAGVMIQSKFSRMVRITDDGPTSGKGWWLGSGDPRVGSRHELTAVRRKLMLEDARRKRSSWSAHAVRDVDTPMRTSPLFWRFRGKIETLGRRATEFQHHAPLASSLYMVSKDSLTSDQREALTISMKEADFSGATFFKLFRSLGDELTDQGIELLAPVEEESAWQRLRRLSLERFDAGKKVDEAFVRETVLGDAA